MECKYLSDGRKVVIIGELNNVEKIVQEIFITESGDEIPSGERFTTRSLHDEPVMSYQEKQIKKVESNLERTKTEYESFIKKTNNAREELKAEQAILKSVRQFNNALQEKELETFTQFLTGTIEYLVIDNYTITPPVKMNSVIKEYDTRYNGEKSFDGLKLVSVLGGSNGNLSYNLHRYSDGSGSADEVYPFTNRQDAINHIKDRAEAKIDEDNLSEQSWEACLNMGIRFDTKRFEQFRGYMRKRLELNILSAENTKSKAVERVKLNKEAWEKYS